MTLLGIKPSTPLPVQPIVPKIEDPAAKSVVVDNRVTPTNSLATYVEGAAWHVNYYSKIFSTDMATLGHDASSSAVNDQYKLIKRMLLRLQGELSPSQDDVTKRFSVRGTAIVFAGVIANRGDLFMADAGDGREGFFEVTSSKQLSVFKETAYEIEFNLVFFGDETERRYDLENKVAATYHFVADYSRFGKNPLVTETRFQALLEISSLTSVMVDDYSRWFYSIEYGCMLAPEYSRTTHDPYLDKFLRYAVEVSNYPLLTKARAFVVHEDDMAYALTLWDVIARRHAPSLTQARSRYGVATTQQFFHIPHHRSLRFSRLKDLIYPTQERTQLPPFYNRMQVQTLPDMIARDAVYSEMPLLDMPPEGVILQALKNVHDGGYYVFSQAFWSDGQAVDEEGALLPLSLLEKFTLDYIKGNAINPVHLVWLAKSYPRWPLLERYYYMPVVMLLMRSLAVDV